MVGAESVEQRARHELDERPMQHAKERARAGSCPTLSLISARVLLMRVAPHCSSKSACCAHAGWLDQSSCVSASALCGAPSQPDPQRAHAPSQPLRPVQKGARAGRGVGELRRWRGRPEHVRLREHVRAVLRLALTLGGARVSASARRSCSPSESVAPSAEGQGSGHMRERCY